MGDREWFFEMARRIHRLALYAFGRRDVRPCVVYAYVPRVARSAHRTFPIQRG
jgi:hypothetical protein